MSRKAFGFLVILAACGHPVPHDPTRASKHLDLCKDLLKKHQLEAAKPECDRAIALDGQSDDAYNVRGLIAFVRAIDTERTLEIDQCLTGVDAEGTHKDLDQQLRSADADFEQATRSHPDYAEALSNRGSVHTLLEDYGEAEKYFAEALQHPETLVDAGLTRSHLAWALFNEKKYVDAARELRQALQFQPKMCVATYRLGRVYFAREEWEKAAEQLQVVSDDPSCGSQEASLYLMQTKLAQGLVNDARVARDACLKISPKSCIARQCVAYGGALGKVSGR